MSERKLKIIAFPEIPKKIQEMPGMFSLLFTSLPIHSALSF
jgi:hypothetical protein